MFFDPMYFIFVGPAILLAMWAQWRVSSAYAMGKQYAPRSGLSGAETAERILRANGLHHVAIEPVRTFLGDHYDPREKVLRLSPEVYHGRTLAALGIAAHESGHALQDAHQYRPLAIRNGLVPMASIGSSLSMILIIAGILMQGLQVLAIVGLVLFGATVLFQLVNLPVEFDASARARRLLLDYGMVTPDEDAVVGKVLNAAAMTYVAATLTAILTLAYYAMLVFGRRD
jgi:Zn-dependent membrane protease YugP